MQRRESGEGRLLNGACIFSIVLIKRICLTIGIRWGSSLAGARHQIEEKYGMATAGMSPVLQAAGEMVWVLRLSAGLHGRQKESRGDFDAD